MCSDKKVLTCNYGIPLVRSYMMIKNKRFHSSLSSNLKQNVQLVEMNLQESILNLEFSKSRKFSSDPKFKTHKNRTLNRIEKFLSAIIFIPQLN
jgi:hypothetical protein